MLLGATGPPQPLPWDQRWAPGRETSSFYSRFAGLQTPHRERGGAVGVGGTAWAAEVGRARGLASLPAAAKGAFGPGLAQLSAPRKQPWVVHMLVCDLFVSFIHLGALFAVGNSFRQFLLLLLMLTMVGTCLLLAFISAQPRSRSGCVSSPPHAQHLWLLQCE